MSSKSSIKASLNPVKFDESEYQMLTEAMPQLYRELCLFLFNPPSEVDRKEWLSEFTAFKTVISISMCSLNDNDLARVNNCSFTLEPLAKYHEVTTRLCRELEEYFYGRGEKLSGEKVRYNTAELKEAREAVREAWKKDVVAGEVAGLRSGRVGA